MAQSAIENGDVPGLVALVARQGKIVYHKSFGLADAATGRSLKKDDIFRIASQTKAITATAVMMLWEEGLFQLDDPISRFIPEFENPWFWFALWTVISITRPCRPGGRSPYGSCSLTPRVWVTGLSKVMSA